MAVIFGKLKTLNKLAVKIISLAALLPPPWTSVNQQAKLKASDAAQDDNFGWSVSISGDGNTAIVGVPLEDPSSIGAAGSAYIFTRSGSTWSQRAKLVASDAQANDNFGFSVSISSDGNTAIVGARYEDPSSIADAGSAYIFTRSGSTWSQQAKLVASDPEANDYFGHAVSISSDGNTAIVSAPYEDASGISSAGSAYIFTRSGSTWSQQAKLVASDPEANDYFGHAAAISSDGNTAIVSAPWEDAGGISNAGSAYIFTRSGSTWSQQAKIVASDAEADDYFGWSVSVSGDGNTAIVGAHQEDPTGISSAGSAYIFTRSGSTWSQQAKLNASDPEGSDVFGGKVALSSDGNIAIVSASGEDASGMVDAGSAYIFTRSGSTWSQHQQAKIIASDAQAYDYFGNAVSISSDGNTAMVGAYHAHLPGISNAGAVYVFVRA